MNAFATAPTKLDGSIALPLTEDAGRPNDPPVRRLKDTAADTFAKAKDLLPFAEEIARKRDEAQAIYKAVLPLTVVYAATLSAKILLGTVAAGIAARSLFTR